MQPEPILCPECWGAAERLIWVDGYLHGWQCECGHFEKAIGRERLFREDGDDSSTAADQTAA